MSPSTSRFHFAMFRAIIVILVMAFPAIARAADLDISVSLHVDVISYFDRNPDAAGYPTQAVVVVKADYPGIQQELDDFLYSDFVDNVNWSIAGYRNSTEDETDYGVDMGDGGAPLVATVNANFFVAGSWVLNVGGDVSFHDTYPGTRYFGTAAAASLPETIIASGPATIEQIGKYGTYNGADGADEYNTMLIRDSTGAAYATTTSVREEFGPWWDLGNFGKFPGDTWVNGTDYFGSTFDDEQWDLSYSGLGGGEELRDMYQRWHSLDGGNDFTLNTHLVQLYVLDPAVYRTDSPWFP